MNNIIYISNEKGVEIPAVYIESVDRKPVVVMAHGLQGSKDEYLDTQRRIAERLKDFGFGSLRIDFRGHGDSKRSLEEFSLESQVEDLITAVEWIRKKVKGVQIIPMGISFGAPPVLILSELYRTIVKKCLLIAPVTDYSETFLYPKTTWGKTIFGYERIIQGICRNELVVEEEYVLRRHVLTNILVTDIPRFVKYSDFKLCIFHGECDEMVPIATSKRLRQIRKDIKFIPLEKTEHGLTEIGDEKFSSIISLINLEKVVLEIID